jgi:hypothetical protein
LAATSVFVMRSASRRYWHPVCGPRRRARRSLIGFRTPAGP